MRHRDTMHLVTLFGIDIELHWTLLLLLALLLLFSGADALVVMVLLFASVVVHELAHSLVARRYRVRVNRIILLPIGGMSMIEEFAMKPRTELIVSLAGPLCSLAIGAAAYGAAAAAGALGHATTYAVLDTVAQLNVVLGVFNLLPAIPLDGGRVWRAFRQRTRSLVDATRDAVQLSKFVAVILVAIGGAGVVFADSWYPLVWNGIIAAFILMSAESELAAAFFKTASEGVTVRDAMRSDFVLATGEESLQEGFELALAAKETNILTRCAGQYCVVPIESYARVPREDWEKVKLKQLASHPPRFAPREGALDAWKRMRETGAFISPVMEKGGLVGVVTQEGIERVIQMRRLSLGA